MKCLWILKRLWIPFFAVWVCGFSQAQNQPLTLERIFSSPSIDGEVVRGLKFSKDGRRLTFLQPKKENLEILDLWEYNLSQKKPQLLVDSKTLISAEHKLSEEEKARRERMRTTSFGINEYVWSETGGLIAFPAKNDLFIKRENGPMEQITTTPLEAEIDVQFSPKDSFLSYVKNQNLYVYDIKKKKEYAVTTKGQKDLSYGIAEFIAQEEMGRFTGYWWSQDEQWLAFTEVDESPVKMVERYEISEQGVTVRKQRYPEVGTANARVRLGIVKVVDMMAGDPQIQWLPIKGKDDYMPRAGWNHQGEFAYQVQSRDQKRIDVYIYNPQSAQQKLFLTEKDRYWVDIEESYWFKTQPHLLWISSRSGYAHFYIYEGADKKPKQITQGDWDVRQLVRVDEKQGWVYFLASVESPLEQHLYRVSLSHPQKPERLTQEVGFHFVMMSENAEYFVDYFSSHEHLPMVYIHKVDHGRVATLLDNQIQKSHPLFPYAEAFPTEEFGSFKNKGTDIYYKVIKPKNFDAHKKYPLVVIGYGGPGRQMVNRAWWGRQGLVAKLLAQKGFIVATFDNRGSPYRGKKFSQSNYHAFGTVEVEDQTAGVKHLINQGYVDAQRVGFFGWSYGGYLSLMLAMKSPDTFKANVSVAPVTDFGLYDTHYTERFMGTPAEDPKAYKRANVLNFVDQLKGRVLVMHGMADDNVLFTNSTLLFKKLQEQGKVYESITYPGAKHGMSGMANQKHVFMTTVDFFERFLK